MSHKVLFWQILLALLGVLLVLSNGARHVPQETRADDYFPQKKIKT